MIFKNFESIISRLHYIQFWFWQGNWKSVRLSWFWLSCPASRIRAILLIKISVLLSRILLVTLELLSLAIVISTLRINIWIWLPLPLMLLILLSCIWSARDLLMMPILLTLVMRLILISILSLVNLAIEALGWLICHVALGRRILPWLRWETLSWMRMPT